MAKQATKKKQNAAQAQPVRKRAVSPAEKRGEGTSEKGYSTRAPLLDEDSTRRIKGVVCLVVAAVILVVLFWPGNAIVATIVSATLKQVFGIGAIAVPVIVAILGIMFLLGKTLDRKPVRITLGLILILCALLGLSCLAAPQISATTHPENFLFSSDFLSSHGGYIGSALTFVGFITIGKVPAAIVFIGLAVAGCVILGFSLSGMTSFVKNERLRVTNGLNRTSRPTTPDARIVLDARNRNNAQQHAFSSAETRAFTQEAASLVPSTPNQAQSSRSAGVQTGRSRQSKALTRKLGSSKKDHNVKDNQTSLSSTRQATDVDSDSSFKLPPQTLLKQGKERKQTKAMANELEATAARLQQTMEDFGVMATVVDWVSGPTVTLFEVDLPPGVRVSKLTNLNDDIALALAAEGVRIFAPIPKTHYVGIEVPNATRESVLLGDVMKHLDGGPLAMAIGKDVEGNAISGDLSEMPHLLIGGTTGSGKSVCMNAMIVSMLMRNTPEDVRFIMIDPKRVEFSCYDGIPHLYVPVVTEPKEAASALAWAVAEMEKRLKDFSHAGVRNIRAYNDSVAAGVLDDEDAKKLPYIVIVIDELADLMMNVGKEVEYSISRLAQLARAAGIHLIVATQRPSANVVTGLIKANITTRIGLMVASGLDSRVILDTTGAEDLVGNGDLLLAKPEFPKPLRVQGCFTSDEEINSVVEFVKSQGEPDYNQEILSTHVITMGSTQPDGSGGEAGPDDPLLWDAADIVVASGLGSTSNIQRKLKVGYSRAGRIMDMLEEKGVVGPPNGSKPRDVLVDALELESLKLFEEHE